MVERRRSRTVAVQLRIGDQGGGRVAWTVDLGNNLDEPVGGVGDDAGVVLGGVVAAGAGVDVARSADLGEPRPPGHGQTPALVVGEVEVEDVDLVQRDQVDVVEHVVDGEEVAGDVEHRPPVLEARPIADVGAGHLPRAGLHVRLLGSGGKHLAQRGEGAEDPGRRGRANSHSARLDAQGVPLGAVIGGRRHADDDVSVGGLAAADRQGEAGRPAQPLGEALGNRRHRRIITDDHDATRRRQFEALLWQRDVGDRRRDDAVGDGLGRVGLARPGGTG